MQSYARRTLEKIAIQTAVVDEDYLRVCGTQIVPLRTPHAALRSGPAASQEEQTIEAIAEVLYQKYYCRMGLYGDMEAERHDMLESLRAAIRPLAFHGRGEERAPCDDASSQPGFYYVFGHAPFGNGEDQHTARIYLNIPPAGAAAWIATVTTVLNSYDIPFHYKALRYRQSYSRVDTSVIYLPRRYAEFVAFLLKQEAAREQGLRSDKPVFTKAISPGVSMADNPPGGDSFGLTRARLIARGLIDAYQRNRRTPEARLSCIVDSHERANVLVDRPWLNPGNADFCLYRHHVSQYRPTHADRGPWLDQAERIGRRLVRDAIWSGAECTWLDHDMVPSVEGLKVATTVLDGSYYSGTSGIATFLYGLYESTNDPVYRVTADAALCHAVRPQRTPRWSSASVFSGVYSPVFAWVKVKHLIDDSRINRRINDIVQTLARADFAEWQNDIVSGRAGVIDLLLAVRNTAAGGADRLLERAVDIGNQLLRNAQRDETGALSWRTLADGGQKNLLGYAHGTSGIADSLLKLYSATNEDEFLTAAVAALDYEFGHFDHKRNNWPDYRERPADTRGRRAGHEPGCMIAWCTGAAGTVSSLANIIRAGHLKRNNRYFRAAVSTIIDSLDANKITEQDDYSLCHGHAGNSLILRSIRDLVPSRRVESVILKAARRGLALHGTSVSWPCGLPGGPQTLGLMNGLAGVGQYLLCLHTKRGDNPYSCLTSEEGQKRK